MVDETNDNEEILFPVGKKVLNRDKQLSKPTKERRKITRRKPGQKKTINYFTMDTQDAIVRYQATDVVKEKEKIYVEEILPAFDSLVENLINVYGFKVMYESKQDLKAECLEFLYTTVHKFDATKGSKAFSYFNIVAKNWLTIKSKQNAKKVKQYISLDYKDALSQTDLDAIERHNMIPGFDELLGNAEMQGFLSKIVEQLEGRVRTENERVTVQAIKMIVEKMDDLDLLSKRAVLLYIREITQLSSKQLSIVLSSLKKHYKDLRKIENDLL